MPSYILAFRGGMPKNPEEGQKMMTAWNAWATDLGASLTDPGAGCGKSRFLAAPDREAECPAPISGYSVVEAANIEAALDIARRNPIFSLGGTIEVAEAMRM